MRLLLDTCTFLWIALDDARLSAAARAAFRDPGNEVLLSAASAFEIAAKHRLGRLTLAQAPWAFVTAERERHLIASLPIDEESALHVARLPDLHRDPFDRLLVAQALVHSLVLLTPDDDVRKYPARTIW